MAESLRVLQLAELDILKQFLAICEQYRLTYFIYGGTLLGAVRHGGFIPWDDDIDIVMPRPDYELFLEYATKEIVLPYQLHTINTSPGEYSYYYARVENTETRVLRRAALKDVIIPAWIDVFPLDAVPNEVIKRTLWIRKCSFYKTLFQASQYSYFGQSAAIKKDRPLPQKIARHLFIRLKLENLIRTKWVWKMLDQALKENDYHACSALINFCGYWGGEKEIFPKSYYSERELYPFEDIMLYGPKDYDAVLTQMYGDYMTPPPEDQREHHYIELLTE